MSRDYPVTETLTRTIALERLKFLSDRFMEAAMAGDKEACFAITQERREIRDQYFKVIK